MSEQLTDDAAAPPKVPNHWEEENAADPYPLWKELREQCPVAYSEDLEGYYLLTSYDAINTALRDHANFSSKLMGLPMPPEPIPFTFPPLDQDPPDHTRYRQLLLPFFTPARSAKLEPVARETARSLAAAITNGTEVYTNYCFQMPSVVIAQILGVRAADHERFCYWIEMTVDHGQDDPEAVAVRGEMFEYIANLLEERRDNPQDDLFTYLLTAEVQGEPIDDFARLGIGFLLLIAGIDTTANTLANSIWWLAQNPEARRRLRAEPELLRPAVEEFLRVFAPVSIRRTPTTDVELSGCPVPAGTPVFCAIPSGNRDESRFPNADEVIFERENNEHIAFGAGIHRCIGAHIARMELRVGLEEFLAAVPEFELDDSAAVEWKVGPIRGPKRFRLKIPS
jgi:cytochrome P450